MFHTVSTETICHWRCLRQTLKESLTSQVLQAMTWLTHHWHNLPLTNWPNWQQIDPIDKLTQLHNLQTSHLEDMLTEPIPPPFINALPDRHLNNKCNMKQRLPWKCFTASATWSPCAGTSVHPFLFLQMPLFANCHCKKAWAKSMEARKHGCKDWTWNQTLIHMS